MAIRINNKQLASYAGGLTMIYAMRFAGPQPEQVKGYITSVVPHEYMDDVYMVTFQTSDADPANNGKIIEFATANTRFYLNGVPPLGGKVRAKRSRRIRTTRRTRKSSRSNRSRRSNRSHRR